MIDFDDAPGGDSKSYSSGESSSSSRGEHSGGAFGRDSFVPKYSLETPIEELPSYIQALNPPQREAVLTTQGPLLVLAGAGSGKTKMLTARIAYLVGGCGVPAHRVLAVTFTNRAAQEMRARVIRTLDENHPEWRDPLGYDWLPEMGTFHSVCVKILRRERVYLPFTKSFVIYDDSDSLSLLKGILNRMNLDTKLYPPKAFRSRIDRAKCDLLDPSEVATGSKGWVDAKFPDVYQQYQKELVANNALDFGEIIAMTYRLFRDHEEVRRKYQNFFPYIHVDEYQDTNRAQYMLLSMLTYRKNGGHQNLCVVGDEDQSIYSWRGADIKNILDFRKDYPGSAAVKLEQNYRSSGTIVEAASDLISYNRMRMEKRLWTANNKGPKISHFRFADDRAEASHVVGQMRRYLQDDGRAPDELAILYRTHAQSRSFEDALRSLKIPYRIYGGLKFYDRKEVKDVLAYFRVIMNPEDSVSLKRVINTPARGIGKTTLDKLDEALMERIALQPTARYWDVLRDAAEGKMGFTKGTAKKLEGFVRVLHKWIDIEPKSTITDLYHAVLDDTRYVELLRIEGTEEAEARIENLESLGSSIKEFEDKDENKKNLIGLLPKFLEEVTLASDVQGDGEQLPSVLMMTLHGCKGLEFPIVFLVGMEEGLFPAGSRNPFESENEEDMEEERRLCYVGMTRAREKLFLTEAAMRRQWGEIKVQRSSRFLKEIPPEYVETHNLTKSFSGGGYGFGSSGSGANKGYRYEED